MSIVYKSVLYRESKASSCEKCTKKILRFEFARNIAIRQIIRTCERIISNSIFALCDLFALETPTVNDFNFIVKESFVVKSQLKILDVVRYFARVNVKRT